ncbi:GNAT family N-acetyltransferase [Pseudonocardia hydrocarbonoxydans]|uniref:N-acetyltransferase n=1 Tax=Pseudonocardia hydrocarbonoxydans TaxID=76726 RepID=A0A4Y3WVD5_9PSEU|nr:GNAT family N-acetyltransferase [Pseudonocardia hydrocarbonoxydans]GEC22847.1 N-acetyltransferase [Pseudonocardia hydrocarbonoxydans]
MNVRDATVDDAAACAAIYAPYVTGTAISFETVPPTAAEMAARIATAQRGHAWLVLTDGSGVRGYAYGGRFAARAAYRWSCEVSVYLETGLRRTGGGRALYTELLPRLAARGYRTAFAGMTLPNEASAGLHRALGFEPAGTFRRVGWKAGRWRDVAWMQRALVEPGPVTEPVDAAPADPH